MAEQLSERPILMTPENAQKCYEQTKTQTRRIIKPQPLSISWFEHQNGWCARVREDTGSAEHPAYVMVACPYGGIGDRLWVRESWASCHKCWCEMYRGQDVGHCPWCDESTSGLRWKPSIHMPRSACRTVLEVTAVRVEQVQDISEEDARAERVNSIAHGRDGYYYSAFRDEPHHDNWIDPVDAYKELWESIHGHGSWARNPWVWVITFHKVG